MQNRDYTLRGGKDAAIANRRQSMGEMQHDTTNAFVKKQQMEVRNKGGRAPDMKEESMKFNAYMCINGEYAQELGREITKGLDKEAFPVK